MRAAEPAPWRSTRLIEAHWPSVHVAHVDVSPGDPSGAARRQRVVATVHLGRLLPADVHVEAHLVGEEPLDGSAPRASCTLHSFKSLANGSYGFEGSLPEAPFEVTGERSITVRVSPVVRGGDGAAPRAVEHHVTPVGWENGR